MQATPQTCSRLAGARQRSNWRALSLAAFVLVFSFAALALSQVRDLN